MISSTERSQGGKRNRETEKDRQRKRGKRRQKRRGNKERHADSERGKNRKTEKRKKRPQLAIFLAVTMAGRKLNWFSLGCSASKSTYQKLKM